MVSHFNCNPTTNIQPNHRGQYDLKNLSGDHDEGSHLSNGKLLCFGNKIDSSCRAITKFV